MGVLKHVLTGAKDMVLMVGAGNNTKRVDKKRPEMDISGVVQQPHLVDNVEDALYLKIVVENHESENNYTSSSADGYSQSIVRLQKLTSFNITTIFKI